MSISSNESFIGSIDQGTTSTRFLIFNRDGEPVASHQAEFSQIYPQSGFVLLSILIVMYANHKRWHEHNPLEIIDSIEACIEGAVKQFEEKGHSARQIKAVGLTNQRETTVVWDHVTGEPLANAIVWTDTRNQALVRKLKTRLGSDQLQRLCGLPLSTYPSVGKLLWLIENNRRVADAYARGRLAFGTIDSWVIYKLNGGPKKNVFVTDPTNASRSMFMNLHTLQYDEQLLDFFRFDMDRIQYVPYIFRSGERTNVVVFLRLSAPRTANPLALLQREF